MSRTSRRTSAIRTWSKVLCVLNVAMLLGGAAQGALYTYSFTGGFANSGNIPDGNPTGWFDSQTISGINQFAITDISVKLNVSGGFNGDLYAYLSYDGILVPLLNRVGVTSGNAFGYGDAGFDVTLSSSAANDVHFYGNFSPGFNGSGQLTNVWQPDGRDIDPNSTPSAFDSASRVTFGSYNDLNPNGTWTLFFADMSAGGGTSQVVSWELDIAAVPEPMNVALGIFAGAFLATVMGRRALLYWRASRPTPARISA